MEKHAHSLNQNDILPDHRSAELTKPKQKQKETSKGMLLHIAGKQLLGQPFLFWASLHGALRLEKRADPQEKKFTSICKCNFRNPIAWYIVVRFELKGQVPLKKTKQQHQNLKRNLIYFWHFFLIATDK